MKGVRNVEGDDERRVPLVPYWMRGRLVGGWKEVMVRVRRVRGGLWGAEYIAGTTNSTRFSNDSAIMHTMSN